MSETSAVLAEIWRGPVLECVHRGAAVVATPTGEVVEAWGEPDRVILPRSACKMIQALPLIESGAAGAAGLGPRQIALASASHQGASVHVEHVAAWLGGLGLGEADLHCGSQVPSDQAERRRLRKAGLAASQLHNNCSGKHAGFLTVMQHLKAGPDYESPDHPVQQAVREATEAVCGAPTEGYGIDGCSAPNFAVPLKALATAMARFARPMEALNGVRARAAETIREAMRAHPVLVAGEGRACTDLIRACKDGTVVKTGAEGVFTAILPQKGLGLAVKIDDGATRGSEAAIAALLARHGALDREDPVFEGLADAPLLNRRGLDCGRLRAAETLLT